MSGHLEKKCGAVNYVLNANASKEHNNQDMKESPIQNLIARVKQIISNIWYLNYFQMNRDMSRAEACSFPWWSSGRLCFLTVSPAH